jgi:hypothetical protein
MDATVASDCGFTPAHPCTPLHSWNTILLTPPSTRDQVLDIGSDLSNMTREWSLLGD